jgi:hypothetical protein
MHRLGARLCTGATQHANAKGRGGLWAFVAVLAAIQVYANFGPPPSSPSAMALTALLLDLVLALLASRVDRGLVSEPTPVSVAEGSGEG